MRSRVELLYLVQRGMAPEVSDVWSGAQGACKNESVYVFLAGLQHGRRMARDLYVTYSQPLYFLTIEFFIIKRPKNWFAVQSKSLRIKKRNTQLT